MRRSLIASSIALLGLAGLTGGLAYAGESDSLEAAPPPTLPPDLEILDSLGLSPEQIDCVVSNAESIDTNDVAAITEVLTQCGVGSQEADDPGLVSTELVEDVPADSEVADTAGDAPPSAHIDAESAAAVLALLGLDSATVDCVVIGAESAGATDDGSAEAIFIDCGVGPLQVLEAIVALDAAASAADSTVATDDTVVGTETTAGSSGNALVDQMLEQVELMGITFDEDQIQCVRDNASQLDPEDAVGSLFVLAETCGISIVDLIPDN